MAFAHSRSQQYSGMGTDSDTTFYTRWYLSCGVFPRMCLRRVWNSHGYNHPEKKEIVEQVDIGLWDADDCGFITDLAYSSSGRLLVASTSSNHLFLLDPNLGTVVLSYYKPHKSAISRVKFVGEYQFVSGSADSTIGYWDIRNPKKALNFLNFHSRPIRSLDYFSANDYLVSSCQEGLICYVHLPTFSIDRKELQNDVASYPGKSLGTRLQNDDTVQGTLLKCPNLNHCYFSETQGMAVISNNTGTLFVIHNLDIMHLRNDLRNIVLDDTSHMQLCWFEPNCMPNKRNRVVVVSSSEYSPVESAIIQNMSHLSPLPSEPIALMRIKTSKTLNLMREVKDWTCVCRIKEEAQDVNGDDGLKHYIATFGSNVLNGVLLYAKEESRYASLREKQPSFSVCGRIIASPDSYGIRLLKFSSSMDTCLNPSSNESSSSIDSLFQMKDDSCSSYSSLEVVAHLPNPGAEKSVLCCRFSPNDPTLLAVGDADGCISFYSPKF